MVTVVRRILWRLLGIDFNHILLKLDYTLLKHDRYTELGIGTYDNGAKVWRWSDATLKIGKYCSIAYNVNFIVDEGFHTYSNITNYPFINNNSSRDLRTKYSDRHSIRKKEGIEIGNDVWIGMNSTILPGIKIGNGVTIAAGSVVNKDIPDYAIAGGTPARIIRLKHSEANIGKLNRIAWWEWEKSVLDERKEDFYLDIDEFISKYFVEQQ